MNNSILLIYNIWLDQNNRSCLQSSHDIIYNVRTSYDFVLTYKLNIVVYSFKLWIVDLTCQVMKVSISKD